MPSRIQIAKPDIVASFEKNPQKTFRPEDIAEILRAQRQGWRLAQRQTLGGFIEFLVKRTGLRSVVLRREDGNEVARYTWGARSPYEIALSLGRGSYLSHATAVLLHGLNDLIPKTIYVNQEQAAKPSPPPDSLTQQAIDSAFAKPVRITKERYELNDTVIMVIRGKWTGRLEVDTLQGPEGTMLDTTRIERTLIDITVRPAYAGGVFQVLEAFKAAKSQTSVNLLLRTLRKLDYVYPYHQCIGFYLQRAGYDEEKLHFIRSMPRNFDFYLTHAMTDKLYDPTWRLFYPSGI